VYGFPGCFAGMAPKNFKTNKGKNIKASASHASQERPYDHLKFKPAYHQDRYMELVKEGFWSEKVFNISPLGHYKEIARLFAKQKWQTLLQPPTMINSELLREFYANALPNNPTDPFPFETFVRGRTISFNRKAINKYLGNPYPLVNHEELDEFHDYLRKGNFDHDKIQKTIL